MAEEGGFLLPDKQGNGERFVRVDSVESKPTERPKPVPEQNLPRQEVIRTPEGAINIYSKDLVLYTEEDKKEYKDTVRDTVYLALNAFADEHGEQAEKVRDFIVSEREKPAGESLYVLIGEDIKFMYENPDAFSEDIREGLKDVQAVLIEVGRVADVFKDLSNKLQYDQRLKKRDDTELNEEEKKIAAEYWNIAKDTIVGMDVAEYEAVATGRIPRHDKISSDFGGMNKDFKEAAEYWMDVAEARALVRIAKDKGDPREEAEREEEEKEARRKLLPYSAWGETSVLAQLEGLAYQHYKKVRTEAQQPERVEEESSVFEEIRDVIIDLRADFRANSVAVQQQTNSLVETSRRLPPAKERARWIDVGYRQENYTRFSPTLEPNYYLQLPQETQVDDEGNILELGQRDWDAIWTLSRAAYFKSAYQVFPDKYIENKDLMEMGGEKMERMYRIPGVRVMLEGYADALVRGTAIPLVEEDGGVVLNEDGSQKTMVFWDIKDGFDFEIFRRSLRAKELGFDYLSDGDISDEDKERMRQDQMLADTIAWDLKDCGLLAESLDSMYSRSGERHGLLPYVVCSDDYRAIFHPFEKFLDKSNLGQEWGAFGRWGKTQVGRIKKRMGFQRDTRDDKGDYVKFRPVSKNNYWTGTKARVETRDGRAVYIPDRRGEYYLINAPECYPTTTTNSFWENRTAIDSRGRKKSLLEFLLNREEISWKTTIDGQWGIWLAVKFKKAVSLQEYFDGGKPLVEQKEQEWVTPIIDVHDRLGFDRFLPEREGVYPSYLTYHNLKVWEAYASRGGVRDPKNRNVTTPFKGNMDERVMQKRLSFNNVGFLERREKLKIK